MAWWKLLLGPWLNLLPVARSGQRQIAIQPPVLCTLYSIRCISALLSCTLLVTLFSNTVICTLTTANALFLVMFHRPGAYCHSMSGTWHRSSALPTAKVVTGSTTISQEPPQFLCLGTRNLVSKPFLGSFFFLMSLFVLSMF